MSSFFMTSKKQRNRRFSTKRPKPLHERFAAVLQTITRQLQENHRQRQLRRVRQQRLRANSSTEQPQMVAVRRALQFRGLQRFLQRRQQNQQPGKNPTSWFWPRIPETLTTIDAAARVMRSGATALLLVSLITLGISAVPLRVTTPSWYLQVLTLIGESIPVFVLASVLALLSLALDGDDKASTTYRSKLIGFSRLGYILVLLLLPVQLGLLAWLFGDAFSTVRTQRNAIRSNAIALIAGANQATNSEQFVAFLRSRNLNANLEAIAAAPVIQVRTEFIRSVKVQQQQQEESLAAANRNNLLRYTANGLRLFSALAILAGFLRGFQALVRRCSLPRLSIEQTSTQQPPSAGLDGAPVDASSAKLN